MSPVHGAALSRSGTRAAIGCVLTVALIGIAGCGYNLPLLAKPQAAGGGRNVAAAKPAKPAKPEATAKARPAKEKGKKAKPSRQQPRHDDSDLGRLADAREHAAAMPAEAYWPYRIGQLYVSLDSLEAARVALRQSLARNPGYAPALALGSRLDYDAARHDDAIAVLESARMAAQRNSSDLEPELLAGLALHYDATGRIADARECLAAVPKSSHRAADGAAATIALRHAEHASAAELAESAVDESPKSAACQNNAGIVRLRAQDPKGARKAFLKAIELDPRRPGPYYNLAILEKYYAFDDAAARQWFAQYRALSNDDPDRLAEVLGQVETKNLAEGSEP